MSEGGERTDTGEQPLAEVDRIRDIIFGQQMRGYEQQFKRLIGELSQLGKELEELRNAFDQQQVEQESRVRKLQEGTQKRFGELERDLGSQLESGLEQRTAQTRQLAADLEKQGRELRGEFRTAMDAMEDDTTSRHDLGDLLIEMGTRLKEQVGLADLLGQLGDMVSDQPES